MDNPIVDTTLEQILTVNFFELFDLPLDYKINKRALKICYHTLQKQYHPDNFTNSNMQLMSHKVTSHINNALNVLTSPLERAIYLLNLNGIKVDLTESAKLKSEFLLEQLQLYEDIEANSHNVKELTAIEKRLLYKQEQLETQIASSFSSNNLGNIADYCRELAFCTKLIKTIDEKINYL